MINPRIVFWRLAVYCFLPFCHIAAAEAQTAEEIAQKAIAATVHLEMVDRNGKTIASGSGFFVGQNRIATNFHVIEGVARGSAKQAGKYTRYTIEGIFATDKKNDLALLKVTAFGIDPLLLGDSDTIEIGETVYVAGNPSGPEGKFSEGIIASIRERYDRKRFQMTARISPGGSGGPVLNGNGQVIGVSFITIEGGQNQNFAIPSNYLNALLKQSESVKPFRRGAISAETYFIRGDVEHTLRNYSEAIDSYTEAIRLKPNFAEAYNNRGIAKGRLGKYFAGIADYDTAIRLKPDYAEAYHNRGVTKGRSGKHAEAIVDYDMAIQLKPDFAEVYNSRGFAKYKLGKHFAAISDYDEAIRLTPEYAEAYNNRGAVKVIVGRTWGAKQDFNTALELANRSSDESLIATIQKGLKLIEKGTQITK